ncbi:MAG: zinc ribbon domain-containing protein [Fibrobacteraceae bacterium]|nr:zinc ribbon domain-containing protein [Fibrobacteraceae bacterium]
MKICPHCGAEISDDSINCKECGSDAETGWSDSAKVDFELPDYDEILENEFGRSKKKKKSIAIAIIGGLLTLVLLIIFTGIF